MAGVSVGSFVALSTIGISVKYIFITIQRWTRRRGEGTDRRCGKSLRPGPRIR